MKNNFKKKALLSRTSRALKASNKCRRQIDAFRLQKRTFTLPPVWNLGKKKKKKLQKSKTNSLRKGFFIHLLKASLLLFVAQTVFFFI